MAQLGLNPVNPETKAYALSITQNNSRSPCGKLVCSKGDGDHGLQKERLEGRVKSMENFRYVYKKSRISKKSLQTLKSPVEMTLYFPRMSEHSELSGKVSIWSQSRKCGSA